MAETITLSVRTLVEFLLCHGDIQSGFSSIDRALLGSRIHRKLQKEHDKNYEIEVFLKNTSELSGYTFMIEGRADGIFTENDTTVIDEIKTISGDIERYITSPSPTHWGQAKCYAYFYAKEHELSSIAVELTYYHIKTEEVIRKRENYSFDELETFYFSLLNDYVAWAKMQTDWTKVMTDSAKALTFPFETYRSGQRSLAAACFKTIRNNLKLYCVAPTGIGKTMSTLFASIKSIGEGHCQKIFYLTAKTTTRQMAENAISILQTHGLAIKSITLTAKDKICFLEERNCTPENCPYAKGYYNRLLKSLFSILTTYQSFTREVIESCAKEYTLCPFELSLDLSLWCDIIIGDYNYLFDPQVSLKRFFAERPTNPYVFLIDEAHNLIDRSRNMYSASISKAPFLALKRALGKDSSLNKEINRVNSLFLSYRKEAETEKVIVKEDCPSDLINVLFSFTTAASPWLMAHETHPHYDMVLDLYFKAQSFLKVAALYNENYITWYRSYKSDVTIKLFCQNPSGFLNECMASGVSSILFSATMSPLLYYKDVLGGEEDDRLYAVASPFPRENLHIIATDYISTKYKDREKSLDLVCRAIFDMQNAKEGNYMVFFPSYQYLQTTLMRFEELYPNITVCPQTENMSEEERQEFLEKFDKSNKPLLTFCVLGGAFSEGIDLVGNKLIGAAIVGVGMPQINFEQNLLRDYFEKTRQNGFDYAYRYPGLNKVMQAAGRVIRTETDRGVVLLIDNRYHENRYQSLMPPHWHNRVYVKDEISLKNSLKEFWQ